MEHREEFHEGQQFWGIQAWAAAGWEDPVGFVPGCKISLISGAGPWQHHRRESWRDRKVGEQATNFGRRLPSIAV